MSTMSGLKRKITNFGVKVDPMKHKAFAKRVNAEVNVERDQELFSQRMKKLMETGDAVRTETGFQLVFKGEKEC